MTKESAQINQKGITTPILIIGVVVVVLIIIGFASGGLKGSFKVTTNNQPPSQQSSESVNNTSSQQAPTSIPTTAPISSASKIYSSTELNFSFEYPEGWKIDEKSDTVTMAIYDKTKSGNNAEAAISALNRPLGSSKDLQFSSLVDMQKSSIKKEFKNAVFAKDEDITLNGQKAHLFEYSGDFMGNPVKAFYVTLTDKDNVYAVTALADADKWDKYSSQLKAAVDSFKLLK